MSSRPTYGDYLYFQIWEMTKIQIWIVDNMRIMHVDNQRSQI